MIFIAGFFGLFFLLWVLILAIGPRSERLLAWLANRTASFRYRDYLPVFVLLGAGVALAAFAGDQFLDVAELVQANNPELGRVDTEAHQWARSSRNYGATQFFTILTIIGTPVGLAVLLVIAGIGLALEKRWRWIGYLVVTSTVGGLLNLALKSFFARARPELAERLRDAHGYSFPSGHAMGSTIVFGALAYIAFRVLRRWRWRAAALSLAATMAVSISASRVYLGVHWISDVAAGLVAGTIWVVTTTVAYESFRRIRLIRALRKKRE
ncbi:MAG TPA: phosphatase PAP2 family protein [Thermoanaerobaculia bacterium]